MHSDASTDARSMAAAHSAPTIKGIFVNSHIKAVERTHGPDGRSRLERMVGRPLDFGRMEDVPVSLEIAVIEAAVQILVAASIPEEEIEFEAGRLHYRHFTSTPWAKLLFKMLPRDFGFMMLHAGAIAERVFKGITFDAEERGPRCIKIRMGNADYPLDHFKGLFQEWLEDFGERGRVVAQEVEPRTFEYLLQW